MLAKLGHWRDRWAARPRGARGHSSASRRTAPTESGFLAVIRNRPRTLFLGEPTAGSTGQPFVFRLPDGALGAVCSRRTLRPDRRPFVGVGFEPDIRMALTRQDLFRGRDSVLERAFRQLGRSDPGA